MLCQLTLTISKKLISDEVLNQPLLFSHNIILRTFENMSILACNTMVKKSDTVSVLLVKFES